MASYKVAFSTDKQLPIGSVPMTLVYTTGHNAVWGALPEVGEEWGSATTTPKLSIEYLSDHPLDNTFKSFVTSYAHKNSNVGFLSYGTPEEATTLNTLKNGITISETKWHLGTRDEMASIFIPEYDATSYGSGKLQAGTTTLNVVEPAIKIGNVTQTYTADYYVASNSKTYGLRFKNRSNKWSTAFRYSLGGSVVGGDAHLLVECIYVGTENITLDNIKEDTAFWNARASEIKSHKFPLYGVKRPEGMVGVGKETRLVTATQYDESVYYFISVFSHLGLITPASISNGSPVYLFKD